MLDSVGFVRAVAVHQGMHALGISIDISVGIRISNKVLKSYHTPQLVAAMTPIDFFHSNCRTIDGVHVLSKLLGDLGADAMGSVNFPAPNLLQ